MQNGKNNSTQGKCVHWPLERMEVILYNLICSPSGFAFAQSSNLNPVKWLAFKPTLWKAESPLAWAHELALCLLLSRSPLGSDLSNQWSTERWPWQTGQAEVVLNGCAAVSTAGPPAHCWRTGESGLCGVEYKGAVLVVKYWKERCCENSQKKRRKNAGNVCSAVRLSRCLAPVLYAVSRGFLLQVCAQDVQKTLLVKER